MKEEDINIIELNINHYKDFINKFKEQRKSIIN